MLSKIRSRSKIFLFALVALCAFCGSALAQSQSELIDWSTLVSNITTSVTTAMTSVMPLLGLILGSLIAWRLFRKFTGGRG